MSPPVRRTALSTLAGRRPGLVAATLGGLAALGFPPLGLWPVALAAMAGFVWLLARCARARSAFAAGWLFGLVHFTVTNNWIATAFTYQAKMPPLVGWAAVPLLSVYLAVWPGLAALAAWYAVRRAKGTARVLAMALALGAAWVGAEWLRSWVFTGYAWGPFSLALLGDYDTPGAARLLPWTGTYALSGLAVALAGLVAWLAATRRWLALSVVASLGAATMLAPPLAPMREGTLAVTVVQPDFRQEHIADPAMAEPHFQRAAALSSPPRAGETRLVLWPESGVPDYLRRGYPQRYYDQWTAGADPDFARWRLGRAVGPGSLLLTGATDLEIGMKDGRPAAVAARNAVTAIDATGAIRASYAKAHLVPYGEYLALRWLLEPLGATRLVPGALDFVPGPGPRTLDLGPWGRAGVQICYEIIFSGEVIDRGDRPDYLFNPSNDGWFGVWGPPQHLAQARLRAIEEGVPVLRATTTGISAIVDARGVVRAHVARNRAERIDARVPPPAPATWFALAGHWLTLAWGLILAAAAAVALRQRGS